MKEQPLTVGITLLAMGQRSSLDWYSQRGLSYFPLGLRYLQSLCYQRRPIPSFTRLPRQLPRPAYALRQKQQQIDCQIELAQVTHFDSPTQVTI